MSSSVECRAIGSLRSGYSDCASPYGSRAPKPPDTSFLTVCRSRIFGPKDQHLKDVVIVRTSIQCRFLIALVGRGALDMKADELIVSSCTSQVNFDLKLDIP
jgi:hypothetical protein